VRAAVFLEADQPVSVEEVEPMAPGPRDVVVRVLASGVCHSDLSVVNGTLPGGSQILGHEGTGVVEAAGPEVRHVREGDRVVGTFVPTCGACWFCTHDQAHLCDELFPVLFRPRARRADGTELSAFAGLGTFAEQMTVSDTSIVRVETDLPDEQLALIGCGVTTGVGAVLETARVEPGASVVVIGCGGVGQSVVQGARIAGAAVTVAVDPVPGKRAAALALGATHAVDPGTEDVVAAVRELTSDRGADYAFEAIGSEATLRDAFASTRKGGTTVAVGVHRVGGDVSLPSYNLVLEGKRLLGCVYGSAQVRREFPRLIAFAEDGRLDLASMVSRTIPLDDVNDAFRAMQAGEVIRSVIQPTI
jgi:S-(hydroxymethyl)glutathione dehydrogenase/alcohol dehydrogenase